MNEEGWYVDPYGRHESRWMSAGTPTALVRDSGVESQDPPPDQPAPGHLERMAGSVPVAGDDLKRADDAESTDFDPNTLRQAAENAIDGMGGF